MTYILITVQVWHFSILLKLFSQHLLIYSQPTLCQFSEMFSPSIFSSEVSSSPCISQQELYVVPYEAFVFLFSVLCECVHTRVCGWRSFQELILSFYSRVFCPLSHLTSSCSLYFLLLSLLHSMSDIFSN